MSTRFISPVVLTVLAMVGALSGRVLAGPGPCGCDADVNNVGGVNAIDVAIVTDCARLGSCGGCVDSCDINCDGQTNYYDAGVAACAFQGFSNCCSAPDGACTGAGSGTPPCVVTTSNFCSLFSGTYQGDDTICVGNEAVAIPAASTWGLVAMALGVVIATTMIVRRGAAVVAA